MDTLCGQSYGFFRDGRCEMGESPRGKSRMLPNLVQKNRSHGHGSCASGGVFSPEGHIEQGGILRA